MPLYEVDDIRHLFGALDCSVLIINTTSNGEVLVTYTTNKDVRNYYRKEPLLSQPMDIFFCSLTFNSFHIFFEYFF